MRETMGKGGIVFFAAAALLLLVGGQGASQADPQLAPHGLAGPWLVETDLGDISPFTGRHQLDLSMLHDDGTGSSISATHNFQTPFTELPSTGTSSLITWEWIGKNKVRIESSRFAFGTPPAPTGTFILRSVTISTLTSPDRMEGTAHVEVVSVDDPETVIRAYDGPSVSTRQTLVPEP